MCRPGGGLAVGATRPERDPGHDADGYQHQGGEQDVRADAEDGQGYDGEQDKGDDREHGDRSPFTLRCCVVSGPGVCGSRAYGSRLPPAVTAVDRDQPRTAPWCAVPATSGSSLMAVRDPAWLGTGASWLLQAQGSEVGS